MTSQGQRFRRRALRRGYKVDEVDTFLDRVEATLNGDRVDSPVRSSEVHEVVFRVRFGGYDEWQVDLHLDRVERQLADQEPSDFGADRMPSDRLPDRMSADRLPDRLPDRLSPERMPERVPERMHDRMPERLPERPIPGVASPAVPGIAAAGLAGMAGPYDRPPGIAGLGQGGPGQPGPGQAGPGQGGPGQGGPGQGPGRNGLGDRAPLGAPPRDDRGAPPMRDERMMPPGGQNRSMAPAGPPPGWAESPATAGRPAPGGFAQGFERQGTSQTYGQSPDDPYADEPTYAGFEPGRRARPDMTTEMRIPDAGPSAPGAGAAVGMGAPGSGMGGPGMGAPGAGPGGGLGAGTGGSPGGIPPGDVQRIDQLRRTFQLRRFGSGYDRAEVDRLFEGVVSAMSGHATMPIGESELDPAQFNLVPGGYFESEVDQALREVRDIIRRR